MDSILRDNLSCKKYLLNYLHLEQNMLGLEHTSEQ